MADPFDPDKMPRTGTAKMVGALILVPAAVLLVVWALVRVSALPEIAEDKIIDLSCDSGEEVTTFSGRLDPDAPRDPDFETATLRVEFTGFLVRAEGEQVVGLDDVDPESGLIDIEIVQEITGPANCDVMSFIEE